MPLVTIVIPTHNRADRLPLALSSLLAQTFQDWECWIVDDGSTDHTREVAQGYEDSRIQYHYQENRQLNGARNTGIRLAKGRYLGFLDDDDALAREHLEGLVSAIDADQSRHAIYRSGQLLKSAKGTVAGYNFRNGIDPLPQFWEHPCGLFGMLIKTELLRDTPFDEALLLLDDFVWLNTILKDHPLHQIDAHTAIVHLHPGQRSATYLTEDLLHRNVERLAVAFNLPGVPQRVAYAAYHKQVVHQYLHFCRQLIRDGRRGKALQIWRGSLKYATLADREDVMKTFGKLVLGA